MADDVRIREEERKAFFLKKATDLWGQSCDGTCPDVGPGIQHHPWCGDPRPEDIATLLVEIAEGAEGMEWGFYLTLRAEGSALGMFKEGEAPPWPADLDARDVLSKYLLKEVHMRLEEVAEELRKHVNGPDTSPFDLEPHHRSDWYKDMADRLCPPEKEAEDG